MVVVLYSSCMHISTRHDSHFYDPEKLELCKSLANRKWEERTQAGIQLPYHFHGIFNHKSISVHSLFAIFLNAFTLLAKEQMVIQSIY